MCSSDLPELCRYPVSADAQEVLESRDVKVIPDILANAGGVAVSYFEWKQNLDGEEWGLEKVNDLLKKHMFEATEAVHDMANEKNIGLKDSAFTIAVDRLVKANS